MAAAFARGAMSILPALFGAAKSPTVRRGLATAAKWGRRVGGWVDTARKVGSAVADYSPKFAKHWQDVSPHLERAGKFASRVGEGAKLAEDYGTATGGGAEGGLGTRTPPQEFRARESKWADYWK